MEARRSQILAGLCPQGGAVIRKAQKAKMEQVIRDEAVQQRLGCEAGIVEGDDRAGGSQAMGVTEVHHHALIAVVAIDEDEVGALARRDR